MELLSYDDEPKRRFRRPHHEDERHPDSIDLNIDVRTMPGDHTDEVDAHLQAALGDLYDAVDIEIIMINPASLSPTDTPPGIRFNVRSENHSWHVRCAQLVVGFTDAGCTATWGQSPMAPGCSARRCHRGLQHTIPWKRRTSRCRKSRVVSEPGSMSPKISSADLTSMNS